MPHSEYEPVLSGPAWETFRACSRRRQKKLADLAYLLAEQPFCVGDYQSNDQAGRLLENIRLEGFILTYWADHSARELRIVDIVEL